MTINGNSPSDLGRPCAITRTEQFRYLQPYIAFGRQFRCPFLVIIASYPAPHPLKSGIPTFRGRLFHPSQHLAELQCP
jgi:hypothetical protein